MNILIEQNEEIKTQLKNLINYYDNNNIHLTDAIINKIKIVNEKLLDVSETLTKIKFNSLQLKKNILTLI